MTLIQALKILKENQKVTEICLNAQRIGDSGAIALAQVIPLNHYVRRFQVGVCNITARGFQALLDALSISTSIVSFGIGINNVGDKGASAFADFIKNNSTIRRFNLHTNKITDTGVQMIANVIQQNRGLKFLELAIGNNISNKSKVLLEKIQNTLQKNNPNFTFSKKFTVDYQTLLKQSVCKKHRKGVHDIAFSPDKKHIISASWDKTLCLWDANTGQLLKTFIGHRGQVNTVVYSTDGARIISGAHDNTIRLWDAYSGKCLLEFRGHTGDIRSVAYSPDGTHIISGSCDKTVRVWNPNGNCVQILRGHTHHVHTVAYSPHGKTIVSGSGDKTLRIWDSQSGKHLKTMTGHTDYVRSVAYSPDGTRIISGADDSTIRIWDAQSGQCLKVLKGHGNYSGRARRVWKALFSHDGTQIISGSDDWTLRLWDYKTGKCLKTFEEHHNEIWSVALSPDGGQIATGSYDNTMRLRSFPISLKKTNQATPSQPTRTNIKRDRNYNTELHLACQASNETAVRKALSEGIGVNLVNRDGNTAMHLLAANSCDLAIAKLLVTNGADLNLTNNALNTPLELVNNPISNAAFTMYLLEQRSSFELSSIEKIIVACLSRYGGDYEHREADKKLLDFYVRRLTGLEVDKLMERHKIKYMGHLGSWKGEYYKEGNTNNKGDLEGFFAHQYLPLRCRTLFEIIIQLASGVLSKRLLPTNSQATVLDKLKNELVSTLETLHAYRDLRYTQSSLLSFDSQFLQAHARNIAGKIHALKESENYCYFTGYVGHAIYANFERKSLTRRSRSAQTIIVRLDNLGGGTSRHEQMFTPLKRKNKTKPKSLPYVLTVPLSYFDVKSSQQAPIYLIHLAQAKYKQSYDALPLIYDDNNYLTGKTKVSKTIISQHYPWRRVQSVGNCVVKNHQIGTQIRWQAADDPKHEFYRWFRTIEAKYIPLKSYLYDALNKSAANVGVMPESGKSQKKVKEAENVIREAQARGYTNLHFATIIGSPTKVKTLLAQSENISAYTKDGYTPIHLAALYQRDTILKLLLAHVNPSERTRLINAKTTHGETALHLAAKSTENAATQVATILIKAGAKLDEMNKHHHSPAQIAVDIEMEKLLMQAQQTKSLPEPTTHSSRERQTTPVINPEIQQKMMKNAFEAQKQHVVRLEGEIQWLKDQLKEYGLLTILQRNPYDRSFARSVSGISSFNKKEKGKERVQKQKAGNPNIASRRQENFGSSTRIAFATLATNRNSLFTLSVKASSSTLAASISRSAQDLSVLDSEPSTQGQEAYQLNYAKALSLKEHG